MKTLQIACTAFALCFAAAGCGDGTLEVKTKSNNPSPVIVVDKPAETTSKEVIKTETRTPSGNSTTKTTEVKTTN